MAGVTSANPRTRRAGMRAAATVAFTLCLVAGEFALLSGVYHRADPVRRQLVIQSGLAGRTGVAAALASRTATPADDSSATPGLTRLVVVDQVLPATDTAVRELLRAGLPPGRAQGIETARDALAARPGDVARLRALGDEVDAVGEQLTRRRSELDRQAGLIYAGLLVIVSIGWFAWFRRLVRRHRALQQAVTERESLARSEQRLLALVQNGSDVVCVLDVDSTVTFVSPSAEAVIGTGPDVLSGVRLTERVLPADVSLLHRQLGGRRAGEDAPLILRLQHADGRVLVVEGVITNLLADPTVGGFVFTFRDVSERRALEDRLTYQAFHDTVTGLANRQLFSDRLTHALQRRAGVALPLVVMICDLDEFRSVNERLGHGTGDHVLETVGRRVRATLRAGDTAARLGGDEFAILIEGITLDEAGDFARRLVQAIGEPIDAGAEPVVLTSSVGMAPAVAGEITAEEVLRNADVALHSAKQTGRAGVAAYDSGLHAEALDRLALRADLQRAVRDDEFVLHYQPTVELETGRITGFEALVRWQHPERGLLSPFLFVPMAEETGIIVQLGTWVLFEACRTAAVLQTDWRRPSMAVNISAHQLGRPDFVDLVTRALAEAGLPPDRLTLEITEAVVLQNMDDVVPRLAVLRERGTRIAIDDFGTGYSSLAYLTELPIDVLKVDKSFIDRVAHDEQGAAVTESIITMSHTMNLVTIAEGVEVAEQAAWLRKVRCPIGQGYYWSRPVDLEGVHELLARPTDTHGGTLGALGYLSTARSTRTVP